MRPLPARVVVPMLVVLVALLAAGWWLSRPAPEPEAAPADVSVLTHRLVVPADAGTGCPGYETRLPSAPMNDPAVAGFSRTDATVMLPEGAALLIVCLGDQDDAAGIVADHVAGDVEGLRAVSGPTTSTTAFGEAVSWTARVGGDSLLTEWYVDRDGVVMVVGALRPSSDTTTRGLAEAVLTTWVWY